jgi:hypothetical protein
MKRTVGDGPCWIEIVPDTMMIVIDEAEIVALLELVKWVVLSPCYPRSLGQCSD